MLRLQFTIDEVTSASGCFIDIAAIDSANSASDQETRCPVHDDSLRVIAHGHETAASRSHATAAVVPVRPLSVLRARALLSRREEREA